MLLRELSPAVYLRRPAEPPTAWPRELVASTNTDASANTCSGWPSVENPYNRGSTTKYSASARNLEDACAVHAAETCDQLARDQAPSAQLGTEPDHLEQSFDECGDGQRKES
jgi:hypothetical protein